MLMMNPSKKHKATHVMMIHHFLMTAAADYYISTHSHHSITFISLYIVKPSRPFFTIRRRIIFTPHSTMAAPNGSQSNWADQVPIAVAPLNCVPYTGPPLEDSDDLVVYDQPMMVYLPEPPNEKERDAIMAVTKRGVMVTGSAANGLMVPIMGSYNLSESNDGFLFRFALPGVSEDEKFKCEIRPDGDIYIQGVTNTGQKESHNMTFDMYTQYLCPPGDFEVRFHLPANVDPSTLKCKLDNGVLEGVVKKKPVQG